MLTLYAQPYDLAATGFYFSDADDYAAKAAGLCNAHGQPVEEFEIQVIDGPTLDCAFAEAWGLSQANLAQFFAVVEDWDEEDKLHFIVAIEYGGYPFDPDTVTPDTFEVDLYPVESLLELAEQFAEDGLFGPIPEALAPYLDTAAIARDLRFDYAEAEIAGRRLVYRCT